MANTQGSLENPFCIDGVEPPRPPRSNNGKAKAYYELHDDRPPTELSVNAIPTNSRAWDKGKSRRESNNVTSDHATTFRRNSNFTPNGTSRATARPGVGDEVITIDDDEPCFTPRSESSTMPGDAKARTASGSRTFAMPRTPSLSVTSPHFASIAVEKESSTPPPSRLAYLLANNPAQSRRPNVVPPARLEEPCRGPASLRRRNNHLGNSDKTPPQHVNAALVDMTDQKPLGRPIGAQADPGRGQTTSKQVETNATPIPARVSYVNEGSNTTSTPKVSDRARKSADAPAFRLPSKPRAVKTASSAPWRISSSARSDHDPVRNHALPPSPGPIIRPASKGHRMEGSPPVTSHDSPGPQKENPLLDQVVPDRELSASSSGSVPALPDVDSAAMGAQLSTPTITSLPLASSEKETTRDNESTASAQSPQLNSLGSNSHDVNAATITQEPPEPIEHAERPVSVSELHGDAEKDIVVARRKIEITLRHHLDERYEDHAYLVKNLLWRQRTRYEREVLTQVRHNPNKKVPMLPEKYVQAQSPFKSIAVVQSPFQKDSHKETQEVITQDIFTNGKTTAKENVVKSTWSVLICTHIPGDLQIPSFKEYVSLKKNILADNESKLLTLPWLSDDEPIERLETFTSDLPKRYEIRHDINALLDLRNEQCRFYFKTVDSFLTDVGTTWEMMLYWLLSSETFLRQTNQGSDKHGEFEDLVLDRALYDRDPFRRDGQELEPTLFQYDPERWDPLLHQLGEPSAVQLRLIALACAALIANCDFSPWYMAKNTKRMKDYVQSRTKHTEVESKFTFRDIMCSVCHEHNCLFHGEIREDPESDSVSTSSEESSEEDLEISQTHESLPRIHASHVERIQLDRTEDDEEDSDDDGPLPVHYDSDDSEVEKVVNYRYPANSIVSTNNDRPHRVVPKRPIPPPGIFKPKWWESNTNTVNWEKRKPFIPCSHTGSCVDAKCRCFRENVTCEKTCKCPSTCNRRFPGCKCTLTPGKKICSTVAGCICKKFKRECDADLCGNCGATDILDPVNRYDEELLEDGCNNVGIQRGIPKKTLLGKSEVHGFGLYAGQDMRKDDVIGEYTGEILSVGESARREIVYVYQKNMYLFRLNKEQEVDATHMGNKLRFINNADNHLSNCYSHVMFCNTVFRVALYANTDIKAGTELFFNYNYPEEMTKYFKQPKGKVVAVKQVVNQPSKAKSKRATSHSSSNNDTTSNSAETHVDRPWVKEALAKARAAKAAKRAAMQAGQADAAPATVRGKTASQPKQARKSASGPSSFKTPNVLGGRGRTGGAQSSNSREASAASQSGAETNDNARGRNTVTPILIVQDTDEEANTDAEIGEHGDARRRPSRPRAGMAKKSAPIVAVKKLKRSSVGRLKRKRPFIVNSDDE